MRVHRDLETMKKTGVGEEGKEGGSANPGMRHVSSLLGSGRAARGQEGSGRALGGAAHPTGSDSGLPMAGTGDGLQRSREHRQ